VLNFERDPLFVEARMFEKLDELSEYELERVLISKKSKRIRFIPI